MKRPLRPCSHPACGNLTRTRYCEDHEHKQAEQQAARHRHYDEHKRDKSGAAFYKSQEWERAREHALRRDHGLCQHCLQDKHIQSADMVDHIIPIKIAYHLRIYHLNLQSLCNRCHAVKTAEDRLKYDFKS
ncbi:HNH endonuclease [Sporosarcina sp. FSL K6-3457]|uniref:HNH endonuclease n=1 Tax=Sporosarcina sp. FSL K6-3457 TaxID=2978204 RepID=UPI0030F5628B